jgi:hypothetical protein
MLGMAQTTNQLFPGGVQDVSFTTPSGTDPNATFVAKIIVDPAAPTFHECRSDNNESLPVRASCPG